MTPHDIKQETFDAVTRVVPAVGGLTLYSITLQEWVAIATLVYIVLQIGLLIPKYIGLWRSK